MLKQSDEDRKRIREILIEAQKESKNMRTPQCLRGYERKDTKETRVALIFARYFGMLWIIGGIILGAHFFITSRTNLEGKPHAKLLEYTLSDSITSRDNVKNIYLTSYKDGFEKFVYKFKDAIQKTARGYWYSDNCYVEIYINNNTLKVIGKPEHEKKEWGDTIKIGRQLPKTVSPNFSFELPVKEEYLYKYLDIKVYMEVHYPYREGNWFKQYRAFENRSEMLNNSFRMFVVSPNEIEYKSYLDKRICRPIEAMVCILVGLVFLILSIIQYKKIFN